MDGDRNDWVYGDAGCPAASPGPYIQDAIGCPNSAVALTNGGPEAIVLETLGYDLTAPEPAPIALLATGLIAVALLRRRRPRRSRQCSAASKMRIIHRTVEWASTPAMPAFVPASSAERRHESRRGKPEARSTGAQGGAEANR